MATGTIVPGTARKDAERAYVSVRVDEGGARGAVEYTCATSLKKADGTAKTNAELKADLAADCAAQRALQTATPTAQPGLSGSVTV